LSKIRFLNKFNRKLTKLTQDGANFTIAILLKLI